MNAKRFLVKRLAIILSVFAIMFLSSCAQEEIVVSQNINKQDIKIAVLTPDVFLQRIVSMYNTDHKDSTIRIVDYSDNGKITPSNALLKLNTEILSGNCPDMICFSGISPHQFISKGLLLDMSQLLLKDNELESKDLVLENALLSSGKMYYLSNSFAFETIVARYSDFGDRHGWTIQEYLDIEKSLPSDKYIGYNMTSKNFLKELSSRYMKHAIDWENQSCTFDSSEYIEILEASLRINENPETDDYMMFGPGSAAVGRGELVTALSWVTNVSTLAQEEKIAGSKLSYIGWPTVDGSCGTDAYLTSPVGILSGGKDINGCWDFIKYMLMFELSSPEKDYLLPMYMPHLNAYFAEARKEIDGKALITEDDELRFRKLLSSIENIALYDENVLGIIQKESGAMLSGERTAEETAAIIQSKVSIYIAEQS